MTCTHERRSCDRTGDTCLDCGARFPLKPWTIEDWTTFRARAVEYLKADPTWKAGPDVVAMCDAHLKRLRGAG